MKIWSSEHVFDHPWENVVKAALQKYPNPLNPGVIGVDVVERCVDPNGVLKSHRLMATKWQVPSYITKLLGGNKICYASEHSQIDLKKQELTLQTRNLTFNNVVHIDEKLTYSILEDTKKTLLKQETQIIIKNVPLIDYMENLMVTKINSNAQMGRKAIEFIINKMNDITDTDPMPSLSKQM